MLRRRLLPLECCKLALDAPRLVHQVGELLEQPLLCVGPSGMMDVFVTAHCVLGRQGEKGWVVPRRSLTSRLDVASQTHRS